MVPAIDIEITHGRAVWIDVLRVFSCFAVILIHTSGQTYQRYGSIPVTEWWFANFLNGSCRCAVPLFVMISGATLKVCDADASKFYRRKALRFLPVLAAWSALYGAFNLIALRMNPMEVINLAIGKGFTYQHLWYLSMYLFMLMFMPFLARIRYSPPEGDSQWRLLLAAGFLAISLDWGFEAACRWFEIKFVPWPRTFVEFIPYFLFGLLLADRRNLTSLRRSGMWLILSLAVSLVANWLAVSRLGIVDDSMPLANRCPLVGAVAVGVFLYVRDKVWGSRLSTLMRKMAPACLGIYLVHPLFRELLYVHGWDASLQHFFKADWYVKPYILIGIPLVSAMVYIPSAIFTLIVLRIPYLNRIVS